VETREAIRERKISAREVRESLVKKFGVEGAYEIAVELQLDLEALMEAGIETPKSTTSAWVPAPTRPAVASAVPRVAKRHEAARRTEESGPTALAIAALSAAYPSKLSVIQVHAEVAKTDPGISLVYMHQVLSRLAKKKTSQITRSGSPYRYSLKIPQSKTLGAPNGAPAGNHKEAVEATSRKVAL